MSKTIAPTTYQQAVLRFRGWCGIIDAGGRGAGKSFAMLLDLLAHLKELGPDARPLVLRESTGGLQELMMEAHRMSVMAFGSATMNTHGGTLTVPTGGVVTFACVDDVNTYSKLQGRSFTGWYCDELGNFSPGGFQFAMRTLSNLRAPLGTRVAVHATMNPHGRSHTACWKRWINRAPAWTPWTDEFGLRWVVCHGTLADNPHLDRISYERTLRASCGSDTALASAWIQGDWGILSGALFSNWDPKCHIITRPPYFDAAFRVGADWGASAPATALLLGRLRQPLGRMPMGSIIVLDETDTAISEDDLNLGSGACVQAFAEQIQAMAARNGVKRPGVCCDDAKGLNGDTVITLLREAGLNAWKPRAKNRVGGWQRMNDMLAHAVKGDGCGLWVTDRCPHLITTLADAPRGKPPMRVDDCDPAYPDHWIDACRYGVVDIIGNRVTSGRVIGTINYQ